MKNKISLRAVEFGFLFVLALMTIAIGVRSAFINAQAEYMLSGIEYESVYAKNTRLIIQDGALKDGDEEYAAEALVRFPDGTCYVADEVVLSEEGIYTVEYSAKIDGRMQTKSVSFAVYGGVFSVSDSMSSFWFGVNKHTELQALNLSLVEGDTFKYKPVIDLSKINVSEELIRFKVSSSYDGVKDFTAVNVRLTDIYDADNYVTINVTRDINDKTGSSLYCKAAANGQPLTGRNQRYGICRENGSNGHIGTQILCSTLKVVPKGYCSLSYDYTGKTVYVNTDNGTLAVADLDSGDYFDGTEWKGNFTTGEVYLSVYCDKYESMSANLIVEKILDEDLSEIKYVDSAPRIIVDYAANGGIVGAVINRPYKLYQAIGFDNEDGYISTNARVFYNYGSRTQVEINVEDGAFTPCNKGFYSIIYTSKDKAGNIGEERLVVYADTRANALSISISDNHPTGQAGSMVNVAAATAQNAIGATSIKVNVYYNDNPVAENVKDGFIPDCAGNYKVEYICNDYIDECKASYTVQISAGTKPVITGDANLPRFLYDGVETTLFALVAYDYSGTEKTEIKPIITVNDDGGTRTLEGFNYTPICSGASTVAMIVYSYTNTHGTVSKEYSVPVVKLKNDEGWLIQNYFYGDNISTGVDSTGVWVEVNQDSSFTFVREVFDDASLNFCFLTGNEGFEQFDLYMQDSENAEQTLKFSFIAKDELTTTVHVNDGRTAYTFNGSLYGGTNSAFNLFYNPFGYKLYDNGGNTLVVERALNGTAFTGFSSRKIVYMFDVSGVTSKTRIVFSRINGQILSDNRQDQTPPILMFIGEQEKSCHLNGVFKVGNAMVLDVLDMYTSAVMTVKDPSNKIAKDVNGRVLMNVPITETFEIKATEENGYGTYTVSIQAYDGKGNPLVYNYVVNVVDNIAPTIEVGAEKLTAAVNQEIEIPKITVTDNIDQNPSVYTFVDYKGSLKAIKGDRYVPTQKGVYYIRILAQDKNGNISVKDIEVVVS